MAMTADEIMGNAREIGKDELKGLLKGKCLSLCPSDSSYGSAEDFFNSAFDEFCFKWFNKPHKDKSAELVFAEIVTRRANEGTCQIPHIFGMKLVPEDFHVVKPFQIPKNFEEFYGTAMKIVEFGKMDERARHMFNKEVRRCYVYWCNNRWKYRKGEGGRLRSLKWYDSAIAKSLHRIEVAEGFKDAIGFPKTKEDFLKWMRGIGLSVVKDEGEQTLDCTEQSANAIWEFFCSDSVHEYKRLKLWSEIPIDSIAYWCGMHGMRLLVTKDGKTETYTSAAKEKFDEKVHFMREKNVAVWKILPDTDALMRSIVEYCYARIAEGCDAEVTKGMMAKWCDFLVDCRFRVRSGSNTVEIVTAKDAASWFDDICNGSPRAIYALWDFEHDRFSYKVQRSLDGYKKYEGNADCDALKPTFADKAKQMLDELLAHDKEERGKGEAEVAAEIAEGDGHTETETETDAIEIFSDDGDEDFIEDADGDEDAECNLLYHEGTLFFSKVFRGVVSAAKLCEEIDMGRLTAEMDEISDALDCDLIRRTADGKSNGGTIFKGNPKMLASVIIAALENYCYYLQAIGKDTKTLFDEITHVHDLSNKSADFVKHDGKLRSIYKEKFGMEL